MPTKASKNRVWAHIGPVVWKIVRLGIVLTLILALVVLGGKLAWEEIEARKSKSVATAPAAPDQQPAEQEKLEADSEEVEALRAKIIELESAKSPVEQPAPVDKDRAEQADMEREELKRLREGQDKIREEATKAADARIAEAEAQLKAKLAETNPGEIIVVHEAFDPKKHKEIGPKTTERQEYKSSEEPVFGATTEFIRYKDENGNLSKGRFVLTPNGLKLENTGFIPKLKDPNLEPYPVKVNRGSAAGNEIRGYWCVREKGQ
jgi:type IV secretory pathway VirB10-like protein